MRAGAVLCLVASGCSFLFVRTPDAVPPGEQPDCTSTRIAPIVDLAYGAGMVVGMAVANFRGDDPDSDVDMRVVGVFAIGAIGIPFLLSARHGFRATGRCRRQEAAFAVYQEQYQQQESARKQHRGRAGEACWPDETCDPGLACVDYQCGAPGSSD